MVARQRSARALGGLLPAMGIGLRWYFLAAGLAAAVAFVVATRMPDTQDRSMAVGIGYAMSATCMMIFTISWKMYGKLKVKENEAREMVDVWKRTSTFAERRARERIEQAQEEVERMRITERSERQRIVQAAELRAQERVERADAQLAEARSAAELRAQERIEQADARVAEAHNAAERKEREAERKEREAEAAKEAALLQVQANTTAEELEALQKSLREKTTAAEEVLKRQLELELELEAHDVTSGELQKKERGDVRPVKCKCTLRLERDFASASVQWHESGWLRSNLRSYLLTAASRTRFDGEDDGSAVPAPAPAVTNLRTKAAAAAEARARATDAAPQEAAAAMAGAADTARSADTAAARKPPLLIVETEFDGDVSPLYLSAPPELEAKAARAVLTQWRAQLRETISQLGSEAAARRSAQQAALASEAAALQDEKEAAEVRLRVKVAAGAQQERELKLALAMSDLDGECTVCCCDIPKGDANAKCPRGHAMCASCFSTLFERSLARPRDGLNSSEVTASRYMVKCATTEGCECHLSVKMMNAMLTEEQAERWEAINKDLYKDLNLDEWVRQSLAPARAEAERAESLRAAFRDANGRYTAYQCPRCRFGPKQLMACDDLNTHHNEQVRNPRTGQVYRRSNACEKCGYFTQHIRDWNRWDGTVWPVDESPRGGSSTPAAEQLQLSPAESRLLDMGYSLEAIRRPNVRRRMADLSVRQAVEAALEVL